MSQTYSIHVDPAVKSKLQAFYTAAEARLQDSLGEVDRKDIHKYGCCPEYASGIYTYLLQREIVTAPKHGYLSSQPDLNEKTRATLMDWLSGMCLQFKLKHETLFLAANIIDRFLTQDKAGKGRVQQVGLTALVIAAKYEEIYPPTVSEFQRATDRAPSKAEILRMEGTILRQLKFDLSGPSVYTFLERYSKLLGASELTFNLALYLAELQLLEYGLLKQPPSLLAAAALYLASKLTRPSALAWNEATKTQSGHSEDEIKLVAREVLNLVQAQEKASTAAKKKYSQKKYLEVAKIHLNLALVL